MVVFEILTVKLAAATECTEFQKLKGEHVHQCPIAIGATSDTNEVYTGYSIDHYVSAESRLNKISINYRVLELELLMITRSVPFLRRLKDIFLKCVYFNVLEINKDF